MKIERMAFHFHNAEKGTRVVLFHDKGVVESLDETSSWEEFGQEFASRETDKDGKLHTMWEAMIVCDPPFNGRFACPLKEDGEKSYTIFSLQAFDVMCEKRFGNNPTDLALFPINSTPASNSGAYALIKGEMNGIPCINIVSKDRQRAIIIASRNLRVVDSVINRIQGAKRMAAFIGTCTRGPVKQIKQWDLLRERMEIIAITVKTADQAFNAFTKYRVYIEELGESRKPKATPLAKD